MSKWEKVRLGDLFKITSGGTPSKSKQEYYENGNIFWIRTGDLKKKYITMVDGLITDEALNNSSAKLFPIGTVLLAMYGATIGACSILAIEAATNQACAAFLPNSQVNPLYLYYFLCSQKKHFIKLGVGGAQPNISGTILKDYVIPLPNLEIQKKIAQTLDAAAEVITLRKKQLAELDHLIKSVFYDMFGDPVANEKGWEIKALDKVCSINPSKREISELPKNIRVSFLKMADVSENGKINLTATYYIDQVEKGFTYFAEEDVLFAKITPCMENGKGAIARGLVNKIGFGSTEFHVLRPKAEECNSYWLYHLTMLDSFRKVAERKMSGSAGQKRVPTAFLKNYVVPIPPFPLQTQFAEIVTKIEEQKALVQKALDESQTLFDSLMSQYFED